MTFCFGVVNFSDNEDLSLPPNNKNNTLYKHEEKLHT